MLRILVVLLGVVCSFGGGQRECAAARIYRILDYPELQQGYSLTGSITTTDNAYDDGTLDGEEIVAWDWAVSGPEAFEFSSGAGSSLGFHDIGITEDAILLPENEIASAYLRGTSGSGRAINTLTLEWYTRSGGRPGYYYYLTSLSGIIEGDIAMRFWDSSQFAAGTGVHVIARAVPEPTALVLVAGTLWLYVTCRRSRHRA